MNSLDLFYISISIIFTVLLFQLSSILGQTLLSTGISSLEIDDISKLLNIEDKRIRMIPMSGNRLKFKILDEKEEFCIAYIIFDTNFLKVLEKENIHIENSKLNELRTLKFAKLIKVNEKFIKISDDGNTFTQIEDNKIIGSVSFSDKNELLKAEGIFKKYF